MKYMFRLYAPKGHYVRDALAAGPPVGYATRGYERRITVNRPSDRTPTSEQPARTEGEIHQKFTFLVCFSSTNKSSSLPK